jgi:hypothetical protein
MLRPIVVGCTDSDCAAAVDLCMFGPHWLVALQSPPTRHRAAPIGILPLRLLHIAQLPSLAPAIYPLEDAYALTGICSTGRVYTPHAEGREKCAGSASASAIVLAARGRGGRGVVALRWRRGGVGKGYKEEEEES